MKVTTLVAWPAPQRDHRAVRLRRCHQWRTLLRWLLPSRKAGDEQMRALTLRPDDIRSAQQSGQPQDRRHRIALSSGTPIRANE